MEWFIGIGWFASLWVVFVFGKEVGWHKSFATAVKAYIGLCFGKQVMNPTIEEEEEEWENEQIN